MPRFLRLTTLDTQGTPSRVFVLAADEAERFGAWLGKQRVSYVAEVVL